MADSVSNSTIIIVGAGLAGLAASLGLAKQGFQVELVERRIDWSRQGSAFGLAANGRKALKLLFGSPEALDRLLEKGIYFEAFDSHLFGWWMVRDALLEQVETNSNITIHMGWTLESFDDTSDPLCVQVTFQKTHVNEEKVLFKGAMLVGADGVYSSLRTLLGLEPAKHAKKTMWRSSINKIPEGSILEPFLDKGLMPLTNDESTKGMTSGSCMVNIFNFHPKSPRQVTVVMNVEASDVPPSTHPREMFHEYLSDPHHQAILEEIYRLSDDDDMRWPLPMVVVELPDRPDQGWGGKGRVTLVGDAAHAMRPASGLGGAMAFEDAVVLCRLLLKESAPFLLDTRDSTEALVHQFETSRFQRVKRIWLDQWDLAEKSYSKDAKYVGWTPEFCQWVQQGV